MYVGVDTNYKGKILQVATAIDGTERGTFDDTIVPQEAVSVSITPRSNNSLMLIKGMAHYALSYVMTVYLYKDSSILVQPTDNHGSDNGGGLATLYNEILGSGGGANIHNQSVIYYDENTSFDTRTYSIKIAQDWNTTGGTTWSVNDRANSDMSSYSTLAVWEYQL